MSQSVVPMLAYEDPNAAIEWLSRAFGFMEKTRILMPDGTVGHAEMETELGGTIFLANPTPAYQSPKTHRERCPSAAAWQDTPYVVDGVLVYVEDISAHRTRAEIAGAVMLSGIENAPVGKLYRAEDLEGHRWMFMERGRTATDNKWVPPGEAYPES